MTQVALDDDLLIEYAHFRNGTILHRETIIRLISLLQLETRPAARQLARCRDRLPERYYQDIAPALLRSAPPEETLDVLVRKTVHKIILTNDKAKKGFPYVNINAHVLESNYTMTCDVGESRSALLAHVRDLCRRAKHIALCDRYLDDLAASPISRTLFFDAIFPNAPLIVYCAEENDKKSGNRKSVIRDALAIHARWNPKWTLKLDKSYDLDMLHDRYLRIDSRYEVILSSGFKYLFSTEKEITCIFRERSQ